MTHIEELEDDSIHEYILQGKTLLIQKKFKHFNPIDSNVKHGFLIVEKGKLVNEGSNHSKEELENFKGKIVVV